MQNTLERKHRVSKLHSSRHASGRLLVDKEWRLSSSWLWRSHTPGYHGGFASHWYSQGCITGQGSIQATGSLD